MSYLRFSTNSLTHEEAKVIADAYFRSGQDIFVMKKILNTSNLSSEILNHPLVKKEILVLRDDLNNEYSLSDHLGKLKEIRDGALQDENWKVALSAEVAVGKAAGLYEPKIRDEDPTEKADPTKLTSAELRKRLAQMPAESRMLEDQSEFFGDDDG